MKNGRRGFFYSYDLKKIETYMRLSPRKKLKWLQAANLFCKKTLRGKTLRLWEAFRSGDI